LHQSGLIVCGEKEGEGSNAEGRRDTEFAEKRKKESGKIAGKELKSLRSTCVPPSEAAKKFPEHALAIENLKHFSCQPRHVVIVPVARKFLRKISGHIVNVIHVRLLTAIGVLFSDQPLRNTFYLSGGFSFDVEMK
jgi:hypothetical protein